MVRNMSVEELRLQKGVVPGLEDSPKTLAQPKIDAGSPHRLTFKKHPTCRASPRHVADLTPDPKGPKSSSPPNLLLSTCPSSLSQSLDAVLSSPHLGKLQQAQRAA